jgi:2-dehydro-3-deoxyphosphogalactonate aldolase
VIKVADVARVAAAGGKLIVMPHGDVGIVREAKRLGMLCVPGVATPTEAFAALDAGADGLKMFPAEQLSPAALKAWRAVLPKDALVFPVGGIRPDNMTAYWEFGANGFGTGSNLYTPGATADAVREAAARYAAGFASLNAR